MSWPGKIAPGSTNDTPIYFPDFLPTALGLAHTSVPPGLDGIDLTQTILHGTKLKERFLYWEAYGPKFFQAIGGENGKRSDLG